MALGAGAARQPRASSEPLLRAQDKEDGDQLAGAIGGLHLDLYRLEDFVVSRVLGTGSFGRVSLARHKPTGAVCAIKALSKAHITKNQQVDAPHARQPSARSRCVPARPVCPPVGLRARLPARGEARAVWSPVVPHARTHRPPASAAAAAATAQITHVRAERDILKMIDHPFIVRLKGSIQDEHCIYFVMEYVPGEGDNCGECAEPPAARREWARAAAGRPPPAGCRTHATRRRTLPAAHLVARRLPGGEFFSHLKSRGRLSEDAARFYAAEVVLIFEHLHSQDVVYRDLKVPLSFLSNYFSAGRSYFYGVHISRALASSGWGRFRRSRKGPGS
jgi:serine/threonine protein kinase